LQELTVTTEADVAVQVRACVSDPVDPEMQETHAPPNNAYLELHAVIVTVVPLMVQAAAFAPQEAADVPLTPYPLRGVIQAVELQVAQLVPQAVQLPEAPVKMNPEPQLDKILKAPPT